METLKVKVKFYSDNRNSFPSLNWGYRPHFMVKGTAEMLGVEFIKSDLLEFNKFGEAEVKLLYENVDYSKLTKGIVFDILEGSHVVGEGAVLD